MRQLSSYVFIALMLILSGCASYEATKDIQVQSEADPKANFSGYQSYAWIGGATIVYDDEGRWKRPQFDADTEIKFLIDEQLRKRGMVENRTTPDVAVGFTVGVNMDALQIDEKAKDGAVSMKNVPRGALAIMLVDVQTGFPIWIATAEGGASDEADDERVKLRLRYAVEKMLSQLPK